MRKKRERKGGLRRGRGNRYGSRTLMYDVLMYDEDVSSGSYASSRLNRVHNGFFSNIVHTSRGKRNFCARKSDSRSKLVEWVKENLLNILRLVRAASQRLTT